MSFSIVHITRVILIIKILIQCCVICSVSSSCNSRGTVEELGFGRYCGGPWSLPVSIRVIVLSLLQFPMGKGMMNYVQTSALFMKTCIL